MPTEPGTDPDIDKYPYQLSRQGLRIFGNSRLLVIPARFADGLPESVSASTLQNRFFGNGSHSVTATFRRASEGAFTLHGDVTRWFNTSITVEFSRGVGTVTEFGEGDYVVEALQAADAILDFGLYDNDGPDGKPNSGDDDGLVDGGVAILNSELNIFCNGATGRGPHPHAVNKWRPRGQPFRTTDATPAGGYVGVGGYTVLSATGCSTQGDATPTLAHELGHLLFGLPDIYQPFGGSADQPWTVRRWILGCWELMAAGSSWGCGSGTPSYDGRVGTMGAWSRMTVGWVQPTVIPVDHQASYDLFAMGQGGTVLRLPIRENEYLLLEYREPGPGDDAPPGKGLLVYHVTDTLPISPPTAGRRSRVNLIEADDDAGLLRTELEGGNRGVLGDAFGNGKNELRAGGHSRFTGIDGYPMPFELLNIVLNPGSHKARVTVAPYSP